MLLLPIYVVRREGNVLTRVCLSVCPLGVGTYPDLVQGTNPHPARSGQGGIARYLPPSQVRMSGRGTPRYLPSLARSGRGEGYFKVPTPCQVMMGEGATPRYLPPSQVRADGTPRYIAPTPFPPPPPPAKDLLHGGRVCLLRSRRRTFLFLKSLNL